MPGAPSIRASQVLFFDSGSGECNLKSTSSTICKPRKTLGSLELSHWKISEWLCTVLHLKKTSE